MSFFLLWTGCLPDFEFILFFWENTWNIFQVTKKNVNLFSPTKVLCTTNHDKNDGDTSLWSYVCGICDLCICNNNNWWFRGSEAVAADDEACHRTLLQSQTLPPLVLLLVPASPCRFLPVWHNDLNSSGVLASVSFLNPLVAQGGWGAAQKWQCLCVLDICEKKTLHARKSPSWNTCFCFQVKAWIASLGRLLCPTWQEKKHLKKTTRGQKSRRSASTRPCLLTTMA